MIKLIAFSIVAASLAAAPALSIITASFNHVETVLRGAGL